MSVPMALFLGFLGGVVVSFLVACVAFPLVRSVVLHEAEMKRMRRDAEVVRERVRRAMLAAELHVIR